MDERWVKYTMYPATESFVNMKNIDVITKSTDGGSWLFNSRDIRFSAQEPPEHFLPSEPAF
jgi:hypothetical protein